MRRFESGCSAARPTLFHRWSPPRKRASTGNPQVQRFSAAYADGDPAPRSTAQRGGGSNGRVRASTIVGASRSADGIWHRYRTRSLERLQPKLRFHRALGLTAAAPSFRLGSPRRPGASCGRRMVRQRAKRGHAPQWHHCRTELGRDRHRRRVGPRRRRSLLRQTSSRALRSSLKLAIFRPS
jgi:hypothetical protein